MDGFDPQDAVNFWDQVNREDWGVCRITQLGMQSSGFEPGRYTSQEDHVHLFDVMVADRYLEALRRRGLAMSAVNGGSSNGASATASSYDAIVVGGRPQRPHRRRLPREGRAARVRARAPPPARRRLRHRGAVARAARLARVLRRLDAAAEDRRRPRADPPRLPPDPAEPRVRDVRGRRLADPAAERRAGHLRAGCAHLQEGRGRARAVQRAVREGCRVPQAADDEAAARPGLQAPDRRLRAAARGRSRRRA